MPYDHAVKMSRDEWLLAIGVSSDEVPEKIILEGTWWHKERYPVRLEYLTKVRELKFPDMYLGEYEGSTIMFCCAYGAPRAVEPVHIFGVLGTKKVIQIGSCGGLQPDVQTGDIVIPKTSHVGEGASQYYGQSISSTATDGLVESADRALTNLGLKTHIGTHISTSALLQQSDEQVEEWQQAGLLGVDMETSAVYSAAEYFKMQRVSMLFVWDELLNNRTWLDEFSAAEKSKQTAANRAIFEVALKL
jgi:purine-nucleoside phosphorylase